MSQVAPIEMLTEEEQEWLTMLAKTLAIAYGTARGPRPLPVRSAVFRGALSLFEQWISDGRSKDGHDPLYVEGREQMVMALMRKRMYVT